MQLFFGWLAWLLTVLGGYLAVLGAVLCLSCGLYYAAELAEEYSVLTGKLLRYATQGVVAGHLLLWLDGFPFGRCVTGILCHGAYAWLLNDYPRLELSSPAFILAILAFLLSHYSWFTFLASGEGLAGPDKSAQARGPCPSGRGAGSGKAQRESRHVGRIPVLQIRKA